MARLKQQHPQDYGSSGKIHTDFDNIVRYINAAELGNKTLAELLGQLFDEDGDFAGPIEFRLNTTTGLEYRVGTFRNAEDGWLLLANIADLRGPAGQNLGLIEGPLFFNRVDQQISTPNTTTLTYDFTPETEDILLLKDGLLMRGTGTNPEYTYNSGTDTITLDQPVGPGTTMTMISIRGSAVTNYRRLDYVAVATTTTIAFPHTDEERLLVFKNGILMREGSLNDYVKSAATDTITFLLPLTTTDVATVLTVENASQTDVAGLMMEDEYTDENGFIPWAKIAVADGVIQQVKVNGLSAELSAKARMSVASTAPLSPVSGDLWLDTSITPNVLKFYQGTQWLSASPTNALPNFLTANANQYLRVNGSGTALEYGNIDTSALVPKTFMGAANGVAALDSAGKIPTSQLPEIFSVDTIDFYSHHEDAADNISNKTYYAKTVYKQTIRIDGLSAVLSSGTCSIQLAIDGVAVGPVVAVSTTRVNQNISPVIQVDATTVGKRIGVIVTSNASGQNLDVAISTATLNT